MKVVKTIEDFTITITMNHTEAERLRHAAWSHGQGPSDEDMRMLTRLQKLLKGAGVGFPLSTDSPLEDDEDE